MNNKDRQLNFVNFNDCYFQNHFWLFRMLDHPYELYAYVLLLKGMQILG